MRAICCQNVQHEGHSASFFANHIFRIGFCDWCYGGYCKPVKGSVHSFKYRLAYVVDGHCVLRYDNEFGKRDHRHVDGKEGKYSFSTLEQLVADFQRDIKRWNDENSDS